MGIFNYVNSKFSGAPSVPVSTGDRYWDQDLQRDHRYYQEQLGLIYNRVFGKEKAILSGLTVLQGVGHTIDVYAGYGIAKFSVEILHRVSAWAIPPSTENDDIFILIRVPSNITNQAITSAVTDGVTVNYVKLAYLETDGNTRARAKKAGSYSYEVKPDYLITVNDTAPTDYEVVLETFTSNGVTLTFLGNEDKRLNKELNEYNSIDILGISTETKYIQIGHGRSGNGQSHLDFIGDATYTDYGLRIIRNAGGVNTGSYIQHRGTGYFELICTDAGKFRFSTSNIGRLQIDQNGNIIIPDSSTAKLCVGTGLDGQIYSLSDDVYIENITTDKNFIFKLNDGGVPTEAFKMYGADISAEFIGVLTYGAEYRTDTPSETKTQIKNKIIEIGDWNMNVSAAGSDTVSVAHNLASNVYKKIRSIFVIIRDDNDVNYYPLNRFDNATDPSLLAGGVNSYDNTNITLYMRTGNIFDFTLFDSTGYNRGWIYIVYEV